MPNLVFFSQSLIELNKEVQFHPELVELLQKQESQDLEVRLAEIAGYCNLLLDGMYMPADLDNIADYCIRYLKEKRFGIVLPTTFH